MALPERYLEIAKAIHGKVFSGLLDGMYAGLTEEQSKGLLKKIIAEGFNRHGYTVNSEQLTELAAKFPRIDDEPDHGHPFEEKIANSEIFQLALLLSQCAHELDNEEDYKTDHGKNLAPPNSSGDPSSEPEAF